MNSVIDIWRKYTSAHLQVSEVFRTGNIIGEYAEMLICDFYQGTLSNPSQKAYDFDSNGKKFQVKSRMAKNNRITGNLSDIHSWDFDFLVVVYFNDTGEITLVKTFTKDQAMNMSNNSNGRNIISTASVRNSAGKDITESVKNRYNL